MRNPDELTADFKKLRASLAALDSLSLAFHVERTALVKAGADVNALEELDEAAESYAEARRDTKNFALETNINRSATV